MRKSVAGAGCKSSCTPCVTETAAPATNRPSAASSAHTYASRPWPSGCAASGGRRERRSATIRNTSLPVSAHERAASARIDAHPVRTAAIDFATATRRLAAKAMRTVVRLAEPAPPAARQSGPRNGSEFTATPPLVATSFRNVVPFEQGVPARRTLSQALIDGGGDLHGHDDLAQVHGRAAGGVPGARQGLGQRRAEADRARARPRLHGRGAGDGSSAGADPAGLLLRHAGADVG